MPEPVDAPFTILFIGGMGRSGSTLLDRMLGALPGVVSVGEFRKFYRRGLIDNELCGCGERMLDCPFWREVVAAAYGTAEAIPVRALLRKEDAFEIPMRMHLGYRFPALFRGSWRDGWLQVSEARKRLFSAIAAVSGARLIVDSSKGPLYGHSLEAFPGLRVRTVHLVRDSRAVAYSWAKMKPTRRPHGPDFMPRLSWRQAAIDWNAKNLQMELGWAFTGRRMRVHYENFVARPEQHLRRILRFAGHDAAVPETDGVADLGVNHTVLGNPMRFESGPITIRLDDEWKTKLPARERRLITAATFPMLLRYGYVGPKPLSP